MKIKIVRKDLVAKSACDEGLDFFDTFVRELGQEEDLEIEWDQLSMVWSLTNPECKEWTRWVIDNAILPMWSLQRTSLIGAYLRYAELYGANLYGARLEGADLSYADLTGANLEGANLIGANLSGAYLRGADLTCSNLERAYYPYGPVPEGWRRTETGYLTKA